MNEDNPFYGISKAQCEPDFEPTYAAWRAEVKDAPPLTLEFLEKAWEQAEKAMRVPREQPRYTKLVSYTEYKRLQKEWRR